MNYSKKGTKNKQRELNAVGSKVGGKVSVFLLKMVLVVIVAVAVCGIAGGVGLFKSILANTPTIRISDVVATGQATIVYDAKGNEIDQYVSSDSNRIEVEWDEIAEYLPYAFVAIEDERFYQHNGIDYKGIVRAGYEFITSKGKEKQGASTITQQLLKNTVFTDWTEEGDNTIRKIKRKIQEQYLALEITKNTEKNEILLRYMNAINLGQNTLGVESASQRYFGKSAIDLNISECAVIASVTQNPSYYNPIRYPEHNVVRREKCLKKMLELEFISQAQFDEAMADTDDVYNRIGYHNTELLETNSAISSYFSDAVYEAVMADLLAAGYDKSVATHLINSGGLRIYTTMDPDIQAIVDEEFQNENNFPATVRWYLQYALTIFDNEGATHNFSKEQMMKWFKEQGNTSFNLIFNEQEDAYAAIDKYRSAMYESLGLEETEDNFDESITLTAQPQCAMVIEDQSTGYVVAMAGGRGAKEGRRTLNRATDALRSPGSTFKVLASFAPAVDQGIKTLASVYNDAEFNYTGGRAVKNWYNNGYRGICSIRYAIQDSLNIIAVKNLTVIGNQIGYDYLLDFGFTTLTDGVVINGNIYSDVNQTLSLGGLTYGVSTYEMTGAYAAIANNGVYVKPKVYTKVTDADGNIILDNTAPESHRVLKETTAYLITDAMHDVVTIGTGAAAAFNGMYIAGKTGTSSDYKDVWFAGYTGYYTSCVWTGYDNAIGMSTSSTNNESAISKKIWKAVMSRVHEGKENIIPTRPEGIVEAEVCKASGLLATDLCRAYGCSFIEKFEEDTVPTEECNLHYQGLICAYDHRIACPGCPFAYEGNIQLPLPEEPELVEGSTMIIKYEDGTEQVINPVTSLYCSHDAEFFADPNAEAIINSQRAEAEAAAAAAAAEAEAAAAAAAAEQF